MVGFGDYDNSGSYRSELSKHIEKTGVIPEQPEVKPGQIWLTNSGNAALIINAYIEGGNGKKLMMLWYDKTERRFNVTEIMERLERLATVGEILMLKPQLKEIVKSILIENMDHRNHQ